MFRLAHISDAHLGPLPALRARELIGKRITGWLNWQRRGRTMGPGTLEAIVDDLVLAAPDHVAVTGDLTNLALPAEIARAHAWMASLAKPGGVSAVPGNHDAYVRGAVSVATSAWSMHMRGERIDDAPYPYLRRLGDRVAIIGCSTAEATPPFVAAGPFREDQAARLRELLDRSRDLFRVVLIHHPPLHGAIVPRKAMRGIDLFQVAVRDAGAELVLHGHTHLPTQGTFETARGPVPVIGVAAAGQAPNTHRPPARWNLFEIGGSPGAWTCTQIERGIREGGSVAEIARRDLPVPTARTS